MTHDEAAFRHILADQIRRYPLLGVQDLYKLVFQASFGSEHAVADPVTAQRWLEHELSELAQGPEEPLLDPISPDGLLVRIHLRPYVASGKDLGRLLEAFLRTAQIYRGRESTLCRLWGYAACMAGAGLLPFAGDSLQQYSVAMRRQGFPAVHHSTVFATTYRPAYRIVCAEFLSTGR